MALLLLVILVGIYGVLYIIGTNAFKRFQPGFRFEKYGTEEKIKSVLTGYYRKNPSIDSMKETLEIASEDEVRVIYRDDLNEKSRSDIRQEFDNNQNIQKALHFYYDFDYSFFWIIAPLVRVTGTLFFDSSDQLVAMNIKRDKSRPLFRYIVGEGVKFPRRYIRHWKKANHQDFRFEKFENGNEAKKALLEMHPVGSSVSGLVQTLEKAGSKIKYINKKDFPYQEWRDKGAAGAIDYDYKQDPYFIIFGLGNWGGITLYDKDKKIISVGVGVYRGLK